MTLTNYHKLLALVRQWRREETLHAMSWLRQEEGARREGGLFGTLRHEHGARRREHLRCGGVNMVAESPP